MKAILYLRSDKKARLPLKEIKRWNISDYISILKPYLYTKFRSILTLKY